MIEVLLCEKPSYESKEGSIFPATDGYLVKRIFWFGMSSCCFRFSVLFFKSKAGESDLTSWDLTPASLQKKTLLHVIFQTPPPHLKWKDEYINRSAQLFHMRFVSSPSTPESCNQEVVCGDISMKRLSKFWNLSFDRQAIWFQRVRQSILQKSTMHLSVELPYESYISHFWVVSQGLMTSINWT